MKKKCTYTCTQATAHSSSKSSSSSSFCSSAECNMIVSTVVETSITLPGTSTAPLTPRSSVAAPLMSCTCTCTNGVRIFTTGLLRSCGMVRGYTTIFFFRIGHTLWKARCCALTSFQELGMDNTAPAEEKEPDPNPHHPSEESSALTRLHSPFQDS